ncbi:MAG: hypothetical protein K2M13_03715 [Muribaculaceae bacterium]|nr:hypothetical protein [Muribaculaceae bacterium]
MAPTPEEDFLSDIKSPLLKDLNSGYPFMLSDERAALIYETSPSAGIKDWKNRVIFFKEIASRVTPGGERNAVIRFTDREGNTLDYPTGKQYDDAISNLTSLDIPMAIDIEMVRKVRQLLLDKELWTRSSLWYDGDGEKIKGKRFIPVVVKDVTAGDMLFPYHLLIEDEDGGKAIIYMNASNRGLESRTFSSLFFLKDPKLHYPSIRPEIWTLITEGAVTEGMTKEECKLSLGNPDDVAQGHDWNRVIDVWTYKNGAFLEFTDGLLTKFRI